VASLLIPYVLLSSRYLERGQTVNHLSRLHAGLAPHYNGLSGQNIKQLDEHLKVMITCVVNDLRGEKEMHPLTFLTIRSRLMQLPALEPLPNATTISKVIQCKNESTTQALLSSQVCSDVLAGLGS
jgi:hypothetical protein